jgi:hypothetical protein
MDRVTRLDGRYEERRGVRDGRLGEGTLACPSCDLPVWPGARVLTPADPLACAYCGHAGALRDFLTLSDAPRPTRVTVRVRVPLVTPARARP